MEKQGRSTVYNKIVTPEKWEKVNPENKQLMDDFLDYLVSVDRSKTTISAYKNDLKIFMTYLYENCNNKFFVDLKKREIAKWQSHALSIWGWSPKRIRRVKSTVSSLSNYVENMLDDEFEDFRPIVRKIESPADATVREKTVITEEQYKQLMDILIKNKKIDQVCLLALVANNGRRKSELPRMKISYFTDENVIYGSLYKTPEMIKTKGKGSRGKMLTVYTLKNGFEPYLNMWLDYRKENNITSEWLIPKNDKGKWTDEQLPITTINSWMESWSKLLGIPIYAHAFRHMFTTNCSRAGLPDEVIKDLVGWNSLDMVSIYKDTDVDEEFGKYFNEDGIKQVEETKLTDL